MILPKIRDLRFITIRLGGTLTDSDHRLLALCGLRVSRHLIPTLDADTLGIMDSAGVHSRVAADLRRAMRKRDRERVATLRTLLAAIDNAEAVPVERAAFDPSAGLTSIGAGSTEASRSTLDGEDVRKVLEAEIAERYEAADLYRAHDRQREAAVLDQQIATIRRYLPSSRT